MVRSSKSVSARLLDSGSCGGLVSAGGGVGAMCMCVRNCSVGGAACQAVASATVMGVLSAWEYARRSKFRLELHLCQQNPHRVSREGRVAPSIVENAE